MTRLILILISLSLPHFVQANAIYKCIKGDKIVFSQNVCPKEFRQHKVEYQLGITTEIDSDKKKQIVDPLQALLKKRTISKEKLLQLLDGEIYRLKQENSYYEILRASELQKLERKRYWHTKSKDDPEYVAELSEIHDRFDGLVLLNQGSIKQLDDRRIQIEAEVVATENEEPPQ